MAISGADRGSGANNTPATSLAVTPASNFAAGSLAVLCVSYDNAASGGADPYSSISDGHGNTWTPLLNSLNDPGAANAGQAARMFSSDMAASTLTTSSTITLSFGSTSVTAKSWALHEITPDSGYAAVYATGAQAAQTSGTPSITTGTIPSGALVLAMVGREGNETQTDDADTSNGSWSAGLKAAVGTTTSGSEIITQRKVVTADGAQTYDPTFGGTSRDGCNLWAQFVQTLIRVPARAPAAASGLAAAVGAFTLSDRAQLTSAGRAPEVLNGDPGGFRSLALLELGGAGAGAPVAVVPDRAPLLASGAQPALSVSATAQPAAVPAQFAGLQPALSVDVLLRPASATGALAGAAPVPTMGAVAQPARAPVLAFGTQPALSFGRVALPGAGQAQTAGAQPAASVGAVLQPDRAQLRQGADVFGDGTAPQPLVQLFVSPGRAALSASGLPPGLAASSTAVPDRAQVATEGRGPGLRIDTYLPTGCAALQLGGLVPAPTVSVTRAPGAAGLRQSSIVYGDGTPPQLVLGTVAQPGAVPLAWTGRDPQPVAYTPGGFRSLALPEIGGASAAEDTTSTRVPGRAQAQATGLAPAVLGSVVVQPSCAPALWNGATVLGDTAPTVVRSFFVGFRSLALLELGGAGGANDPVSVAPDRAQISASGRAPWLLATQASLAPRVDDRVPLSWRVDPGWSAMFWSGPVGVSPANFYAVSALRVPGRAQASLAGAAPAALVDRSVQSGAASAAFDSVAPALRRTHVYPPIAVDPSIPAGYFADGGWAALYLAQPRAPVAHTRQDPPIAVDPSIPAGYFADGGYAALYLTVPWRTMQGHTAAQPGAAQSQLAGLPPVPALSNDVRPAPDRATALLTGHQPYPIETHSVLAAPQVASLLAAGHLPQVVLNALVQPGAAQALLAGLAPVPAVSSLAFSQPDAAQAQLAGLPLVPAISGHVLTQPGRVAAVMSGYAISIGETFTLHPGVGAATVAGSSPTPAIGPVTYPQVALAESEGLEPELRVSNLRTALPDRAALLAGGQAPLTLADYSVRPAAGAALAYGLAPAAAVGLGATPETVAMQAIGRAPLANLDRFARPDAVVAALSGRAPASSIGRDEAAQPGAATAILEGCAAQVRVSSLHIAAPGAAGLAVLGTAPAANAGVRRAPGHTLLSISGPGPQIVVTHDVVAAPGPAAALLYGPDPYPTEHAHQGYPAPAALLLGGLAPAALLKPHTYAGIPESRAEATRRNAQARHGQDPGTRHGQS